MTEITQLTLYTEGFTSEPSEINLIARGSEIHPKEMAVVVEGLFEVFRDVGGVVAMIDFLSQSGFSMNENGVEAADPAIEYFVPLIPEEMANSDGIELGHSDGDVDFEFKTVDEWKEE